MDLQLLSTTPLYSTCLHTISVAKEYMGNAVTPRTVSYSPAATYQVQQTPQPPSLPWSHQPTRNFLHETTQPASPLRPAQLPLPLISDCISTSSPSPLPETLSFNFHRKRPRAYVPVSAPLSIEAIEAPLAFSPKSGKLVFYLGLCNGTC